MFAFKELRSRELLLKSISCFMTFFNLGMMLARKVGLVVGLKMLDVAEDLKVTGVVGLRGPVCA